VRGAVRALQSGVRAAQDRWLLSRCRVWLDGKARRGELQLVRRIFNVAVLTDGATHWKLGYREPNTVCLEHQRWRELFEEVPELRPHLPLLTLLELAQGLPCLSMPTMRPLPDEAAVAAAREVLLCLRHIGDEGRGRLEDLPQVERGLSMLAGGLPALADAVRAAVREAADAPMSWGPAHGDFHAANLLWLEGKAKLIDFDCVRRHSLQAFDWLYFDVEHAARRDALPWLQVVARRLRGGTPGALERGAHDICLDHPGLLMLFALDRIGQEAEFGIRPNRDALGDVMTTALARWKTGPRR
jgi:Phosphotransferase enzyme family